MKFIENNKLLFKSLKGKDLICIGCGVPVNNKGDAAFAYLWGQNSVPSVMPYHKKCFDSMKKGIKGISIIYTPATIDIERIPSYLRLVKWFSLCLMILPLVLLISGLASLGVLLMNFFFPGRLGSFYNISGVSGILLTFFLLFAGAAVMYFLIANLITVRKIRKFIK